MQSSQIVELMVSLDKFSAPILNAIALILMENASTKLERKGDNLCVQVGRKSFIFLCK